MKIYNVNDPEFTNYGRIIEGYEEEKKAIEDAFRTGKDKTQYKDGKLVKEEEQ